MSDVKGMDDFTRDMRRAAEMGERAAYSEIFTAAIRAENGFILNGMLSGSDKIRHDFRKGILNRYVVTPEMDDWEREATLNARRSLNAAYYGQDRMISVINRKPEVVTFDAPGEVDAMIEVEMPPATAELVSA